MESKIRRVAVCLLLVSVLVISAGLAGEVVVETIDGFNVLRVDQQSPFHRTTATIDDLRVVEMEDAATTVVTWTETSAQGGTTPYYALGLAGGPVGGARATSYRLMLNHGPFDPLLGVPAVESALAAGAGSRLYIVQFITQPLEAYRDRLRSLGASIRHFLPYHALIVEMSGPVRQQVEQLDFVRWVGPYHPAYRVERILRADAATLAGRFPSQRYNILLFESDDDHKTALARRMERLGINVDQADAGKFLMVATLSARQLLQVAQWDEVAYIDRWSPLERDMDIVRRQGGADELETVAGYTGQGVRGEAFDTGFNINHPDFASRPPIEHGGPVGVDAHGNACLGICFGDGTGDAQARGLLPDGQPICADYNNIGLTGQNRYDHTGELKQAPYFAVFQTASVGSARTTEYTTISADHDTLLFDWDILHCQSQSNAGNQNSRPQAWAKNVVSGGAFNHYDTEDTSDDCWCGTASIGPAADGRIKPDLSFYYDRTYTTYSSGDGYGQFGGTSGATPSICGHFGLFFQMWADGIFGNEVDPSGTVFDNRPHMTTAKAFMINTAIQYPFSGQDADMTRVHQGWGVPNVKHLYDLRDKISFIDESVILTNTETVEFNTLVDAGEPALKVTMTYADPAGNPASTVHRINDLTLKVTSPSGTVYWGNNGLLDGNWSVPGGSANTIDTVENVFVENPEDGVWVVAVIASEIVQDSHVETPEMDADFALVVSGGQIVVCTSDGAITMSANAYSCDDEISIRVVDCDPNTDDATVQTLEVTIASDTEPAGETVLLTESDPASATFIGTIRTGTSGGDGVLLVTDGDTITATYIDEDDGLGGTNVTKTDEALADCTPPVITNVRDEDVGLSSASVLWSTNEKADTVLLYGPEIPPSTEKRGYGRVLDHRIDLDGLAECTIYYYQVSSTDAQGNEKVDDNAGQYYYFETLGDFGNGPVSCHRGEVDITETAFSCHDTITVRLSDLDENKDPGAIDSVVVEITSTTETTAETVLLSETGVDTSTFEGTIGTDAGPAAADGLLQTSEGDVITATYHDADDGTGAPGLSFDTARADCLGPVITALTVDTITDQRATVRWSTDVRADTVLEWGPTPSLGEIISQPALTTSHAVTLNRSDSCGALYFRVSGTDGFGDTTEADENGAPFSLNTGLIPGLYFRDSFEDGNNGWTLEGEWEIGPPEGRGGSSGRSDPTAAYNNDAVLGHDLSGLGAYPGDFEANITESAWSPAFDGSTWANTKLIYYRSLQSGSGDDAMLRVWVGQGFIVWRSEDQPVSDPNYGYVSFDLSGLTDGKPSVQFEFLQTTNGSGQYAGWTLDDFIVKDGSLPDYGACQNCGGVPSFGGATGATDNDACGATGVTVSWDAAVAWGTGAGGSYAIYRGESPDFLPDASSLIASGVAGTSFDDTAAPTDRDLWYIVRAESDESCSSGPANGGVLDANLIRARVAETTDRPAPAEVLDVQVTLVGDAHVRLSWSAVSGASRYRIYRSTSPDRADRGLLGETDALLFEDLDSGANRVSYYYDVIGVNPCDVEGP